MSVLNEFVADLEKGFLRYGEDLWSIGRSDGGYPCFPEDDAEVAKRIRVASGRCGAACGAAVKRAKRELVFEYLVQLKASGEDLTYHTVQNFAVRLLGRKFQGKAVLLKFATPGRTASNKASINTEVFAEAERVLHGQLKELNNGMELAKIEARINWAHSSVRKKVLEDWHCQRVDDLEHKI